MLHSPWIDGGLAALIGLLIGSFLNVVIYRTPGMMYRAWLDESLQALGEEPDATGTSLWRTVFGPGSAPPAGLAEGARQAQTRLDALPRLSLSKPRSHCRACGHTVRWYENIPLLSYALLRGRCGHCGQAYGLRYPAVELLTGLLFLYCGWRWGISPEGALWGLFCALLVTLAFIDWDTTLLPDHLVQPLLWIGLIGSALGLTETPLPHALWGAISGYLSLWLVCAVFQAVTGRQGMGHGDFKLLAALGAWLGWQALVPIVLLSSVAGVLGGLALHLSQGLRAGGYFPFGPFLVAAGLATLVLGPYLGTQALLIP